MLVLRGYLSCYGSEKPRKALRIVFRRLDDGFVGLKSSLRQGRFWPSGALCSFLGLFCLVVYIDYPVFLSRLTTKRSIKDIPCVVGSTVWRNTALDK